MKRVALPSEAFLTPAEKLFRREVQQFAPRPGQLAHIAIQFLAVVGGASGAAALIADAAVLTGGR